MRRHFFFFLVVLLLCLPGAVEAATLASNLQRTSAQAELTAVRFYVHKDAVTGASKLRVVVDASAPVATDVVLNQTPSPRLTINAKGAQLNKGLTAKPLDGAIASRVSFAALPTTGSRIMIDLPAMVGSDDYKVFTLRADPKANKPDRIVIDINEPLPITDFSFTAGLKGKVIALDPGHGGSDPGAVGSTSQEKNVTLPIALNVQSLLEKAGAKVYMTRRDDRDVYGANASATEELGARTAIGNTNKADLFISIHINSFSDPNVGGIASYYFAKTGYDSMLAQNLQSAIIDKVGDSNWDDRGTNQARFYVLRNTRMPAVLLELGFISNPTEEKLMNTPQFQLQAAQGIVQGLDKFFAQAAKAGGKP